MLARNLIKKCCQTRIRPSTWNRAYFSEFKNSELVNKALDSFKGKLDPEAYKQLLEISKPQEKIHLFKIYWFTKWFFIITRYQILGYCIGGGIYSLYLTGVKWAQLTKREGEDIKKKERKEIANNKKKIVLSVIVLFISGILASYTTSLMGKRLVKNIYWLPGSNKIQLDYFSLLCGNKPLIVDPKKIQPLVTPRRFDSTVRYQIVEDSPSQNKLFSTRGVGNWANKDLFEYLIEQPKKKSNN